MYRSLCRFAPSVRSPLCLFSFFPLYFPSFSNSISHQGVGSLAPSPELPLAVRGFRCRILHGLKEHTFLPSVLEVDFSHILIVS